MFFMQMHRSLADLAGCPKFQAMNSENRFITAKKLELCINCHSEGYVVSKCKHCNKSHHTIFHRKPVATQNCDMPPTNM